ncbi:MAG: FkbM family methyltransferase [Pirellulaceae bacterium]
MGLFRKKKIEVLEPALPSSPRFYGQFHPPSDKVIFERYFSNYGRPGYFVECGAYDGEVDSNCRVLEEHYQWQGLNLECQPYLYMKLCKNRPNSENLRLALSGSMGKSIFKHAIHPELGFDFGNGSLGHTKDHLEELEQLGCEFEEVEVSCVTLDYICSTVAQKRIDLFSLDIEGHEEAVLKGLSLEAELPLVFAIETGHLGAAGIEGLLRPFGYRFDGGYQNNSFFLHDDFDYCGNS